MRYGVRHTDFSLRRGQVRSKKASILFALPIIVWMGMILSIFLLEFYHFAKMCIYINLPSIV